MEASDLLELNVVAGNIALVAGGGGLGRKIRRVTVMEAPDLPELLSGGELVLTTLYQLRDDVREQVRLVRRMNEKGVSALIVKMGRFVSDIAPEVKAAADEVQMPLMTIGKDIVFRDLIFEVVRKLVEEDSSDRDSRIVDAVARSDNVRQICETIEETWLSPCALIGPLGYLIEVSSDVAYREYSAWAEIIRRRLGKDLTDGSGPRSSMVLKKDGMKDGSDEGTPSILLFPCRPGGKLLGYLVVFAAPNRIPTALAGQLASILALKLLQDASGLEIGHTENLKALEAVLGGGQLEGESLRKIEALGLAQGNSYVAVSCAFKNKWQEIPHLVGRYMSRMKAEFDSSVSAPRGSEVVTLVSLKEEPRFALGRMRRSLPSCERIVRSHPSFAGMAVGSFETGPMGLKTSYENCRAALDVGRRRASLWDEDGPDGRIGGCFFYDDFLLEIALLRLGDLREFSALTARYLDPIIEYDRQYRSGLLKTLQLYVRAGDLQEVAGRLHMHPNTVRYRLGKIAELTSLDPETPRGLAYFSILLTVAGPRISEKPSVK